MRILTLVCGVCLSVFVCAKELKDSTSANTEKSDTSDFYKKIENWSSKKKITKWLFSTLVVPESVTPVRELIPIDPYSDFLTHAGKRISSVRFTVLPPFGCDVSAPEALSANRRTNFQNSLHIKTLKPVARMFSMLKSGEPFNPEKAKETERLLRENEFIRDAKVHLMPNDSLNEVEIWVVVQDVWSLVLEADGDLNQGKASLVEKNLLGLGHFVRYQEQYRYQIDQGMESFRNFSSEFNYVIPNVLNTFSSLRADYRLFEGLESKRINLFRPFYSPSTRTSYGAFINQNDFMFSRGFGDTINPMFHSRSQIFGFFGGKSFRLFKNGGIYADRLVTYISYQDVFHPKRPGFDFDTLYYLQNRQEILFSIGLAKRNFYKERYLFELGRNEDIPVGRSFNLVGGKILGEIKNFDYLGFDYQYANRSHKWGHIAFYAAYGKFFGFENYSREYQRFRSVYFTPVFGKSKGLAFRQIINIQYLNGVGTLPRETADINRFGNFFGVGSAQFGHQSNLVINYQTLVFSPIKWIGFNFVPIVFGSTAWTAPKSSQILKNQPLQVLGLGLRIKNDRIATSLIQISFGFLFGNPNLVNQTFLVNPSNILQNNLKDLQPTTPSFVTID